MSRALGWFLVAGGLVALGAFAGESALGLWQQHLLDQAWERQSQMAAVAAAALGPPAPPSPGLPRPVPDMRPLDGVDFAIEVPRIGYHAAVQEGVGFGVLAAGPGHYPATAWPGQPGNVGVAAHNVYWIRFDQLQPGDKIVLQTRWGDYVYSVTAKRVVAPSAVEVLAQKGPPRLTLTTCWPLWAGSFATQRLVISALQIEPPPLLPE